MTAVCRRRAWPWGVTFRRRCEASVFLSAKPSKTGVNALTARGEATGAIYERWTGDDDDFHNVVARACGGGSRTVAGKYDLARADDDAGARHHRTGRRA